MYIKKPLSSEGLPKLKTQLSRNDVAVPMSSAALLPASASVGTMMVMALTCASPARR